MDQSVALISEAKSAVQDPNTPNKQLRLAQAAKAVSQALNQVVNCLPGQIEFDHAIKAIAEASRKLQSGKVSNCTLNDVWNDYEYHCELLMTLGMLIGHEFEMGRLVL